MTQPGTQPSFAFAPDPDLGADGASCAGGISEGSRLRHIACPKNPSLFWEVTSDGSIVHAAGTDFTQTAGGDLQQSVSGNYKAIICGDGMVQYLGSYDLTSDGSITHAAETNFTQTAGGNLQQSVSGDHEAIICGDGMVQYLGSYDLTSDQSIFLRVGQSALEISAEGVFLHLPTQPRRNLWPDSA